MMKIKEIRKKLGMTLSEVSKDLKIPVDEYEALENGKCVPSIEQLIKLSDLFGVSIDKLLGHINQNSRNLSGGELIWLNIRKSLSQEKLKTITEMLNGLSDLELSEIDMEKICKIEEDEINDFADSNDNRMKRLFNPQQGISDLNFDDYLILQKINEGENICFAMDDKEKRIETNYSFTYEGKVYSKKIVGKILEKLIYDCDLLNLLFYFQKRDKYDMGVTLKRKAKALLQENKENLKKN